MLKPPPQLQQHPTLRWVLVQVLIVLAGIFFYFQVRGLTNSDPDTATAHALRIIRFEKSLGIDFETDAQAPLREHAWLHTFANWVYIWGHWPVIIATMIWLLSRHRTQFLRLRDAMLVSGGLGLIVFVTFPVAPPRLVEDELMDTITMTSRSYRVLQPPNFVNQYAAMPSLHVGWDLLVGISIVTATTSVALRLVGCLLPVLMAYAVIATANHYVVDVIAGTVFALVGYAAAVWIDHRRERRRAPPEAIA